MSLKTRLLSTSRSNKKLLALLSDSISIVLASIFALAVSELDYQSIRSAEILRLAWTPFLCIATFWFFGVYDTIVRYINLTVIFILAKATLAFGLLSLLSKIIDLYFIDIFFPRESEFSISLFGWLVGFITFSFLILSSRLIANYLLSDRKYEKKVVIYGAGSAGMQLSEALRVSKEMQPIAYIDNNSSLQGTFIGGLRVIDPIRLEKLALRGRVDEVLIAMPSASKSTLRNLLKEIEKLSVKVRILPGFADLAQGKISVSELKEVDIVDLLGRSEVEADQDLINKNIKNKTVLITGAGGSIGSEISRQVFINKPRKVILLDSNEYALYSIKNELSSRGEKVEIFSILASVTNRERILEILKTFKVDTIYHSAAYKHVSLVEENPFEAVVNNIFGTQVIAECAIEANTGTLVLISTDKAVRPTNIMGATKRFAELLLQALSVNNKTNMTMVRFGNVIGSSGSAIPLFQQQIKEGGPVTVTHPEVIRYFMSIPEAAELVIQAGSMSKGGDVFVLDMGEPVKIVELAKRLIKLSGMDLIDENNPQGDIEIKFTGLKPGEKLYEELLIGDNVSKTEHQRILKAKEEFLPYDELKEYLDLLKKAEKSGDIKILKTILQEVVTGFIPETQIVDVVHTQKNIKDN